MTNRCRYLCAAGEADAAHRDLRALDPALAVLARSLAGPRPDVPYDTLRRLEILGAQLASLAERLRALPPVDDRVLDHTAYRWVEHPAP